MLYPWDWSWTLEGHVLVHYFLPVHFFTSHGIFFFFRCCSFFSWRHSATSSESLPSFLWGSWWLDSSYLRHPSDSCLPMRRRFVLYGRAVSRHHASIASRCHFYSSLDPSPGQGDYWWGGLQMDHCSFRRSLGVPRLSVRVDSICAHAGGDHAWACWDIWLGLFVDVSLSHRYTLAAGFLWEVELFHQYFIHCWPRVGSDSLGDTTVEWVVDLRSLLWWVHGLICWFRRLHSISTFLTEDLRDLPPLTERPSRGFIHALDCLFHWRGLHPSRGLGFHSGSIRPHSFPRYIMFSWRGSGDLLDCFHLLVDLPLFVA
jgi:hypothetical protein